MAIYQMRFELGRPRYRSVQVSLETDKPVFQTTASSEPRDSIGQLASAVAATMKGGPPAVVVWNAQPVEYEFSFGPDREAVLLVVSQWPDSRRARGLGKELLRVRGRASDVCLPFWRALQRLHTQMPGSEYKIAWGHPLPSAAISELTSLVQHSKAAH